ncbi:MAG: methylmalonyl-CoA mutase family protein [Bacteroidales bacterium]|jgi:methylmalonyl-CoA mutase|nr:methylmalonyl-CoA mutase family protein [Bacteroidales bacterium]
MSNNSNTLFGEFAPVTPEQWKEKTIIDIKGADFDKRMVWKTIDGFSVEPLYWLQDLNSLSYLDVMPGQFPFTRGTKKTSNEWYIRQAVQVTTPAEANAKALNILQKGVSSLAFEIADGSAWTQNDMSALLKSIELEAIETCFVVGCGKRHILNLFTAHVASHKFDTSKIHGSINAGYLNSLIVKGAFCCGTQADSEKHVQDLIAAVHALPKFRVIEIDANTVSNAGSTISQELACALAMGVEYLSAAEAQGLNAGVVAPRMKFNFAVSSNYFMEIAKFRAAKMLWAKIVEAYKPECNCEKCECQTEEKTTGCACCAPQKICTCAGKINIHAVTSIWNKSLYDPYVNMLRTQTEAMSAVIGGVNSLTVLPFVGKESLTPLAEPSQEFSERIARNQQSLLKDECHFDKIVDPSAGSYYIETLTDKIAESAWTIFLGIQEKGGFAEAFKAGFIQSQIEKSASTHNKNVATRRENLLGVNQFPNFNEVITADVCECAFKPVNKKADNAIAEPLHVYRGAQAFELMRYNTDTFAKTKGRPKVFMLTIGNLTFRKARAQFACNFFACAGFEVIDNNGFATIDEGVKAAKESGAQIVVICSSDDEYAEVALPIFEKLQDKIVVVAGAPACSEELAAKGLKNFISVKSNVLETLQQYQSMLGI